MFLMKLNLEECGLWWEAAMICEVCVVEGQQGDFHPGAQWWCSRLVYLQQEQVPSLISFLHLQLFSRTQAMWFKCKLLVCARDVRAAFFLLLAAMMYVARRLHISQAFSPSLVPTVWPLTPCVPAQFELMQDEAMQKEVSSETIVSKHGHPLCPSFLHSILFGFALRQLGAISVVAATDVALSSVWRNTELPLSQNWSVSWPCKSLMTITAAGLPKILVTSRWQCLADKANGECILLKGCRCCTFRDAILPVAVSLWFPISQPIQSSDPMTSTWHLLLPNTTPWAFSLYGRPLQALQMVVPVWKLSKLKVPTEPVRWPHWKENVRPQRYRV